MHTVYMIFGGANTISENGLNSIHKYSFETEGEVNAFLLGVEAMDGWTEYEQADTYEDAVAYVKQYADIIDEKENPK